ncbi:MAG: metallophosphoesterase [Leptospira sp.]|nr:metallophosphoesterase [Leptospira sp.]
MKLFHISDLHFPVSLPFLSLRGKMFPGYLNYTFRRKGKYPEELYNSLVQTIRSNDYDCLVISGDLTNVSHEKEFAAARKKLEPLLNEKVFMIPGNHDRYVREPEGRERLFEKYFGEFSGKPISGNDLKYIRYKKVKGVSLFGWDSNSPRGFGSANGFVQSEVIAETKKFLGQNQIKDYILVCHHPVWNPPGEKESIYHKMDNREEVVRSLLSNPPVVYLHGHVHDNSIKETSAEIPFYIVNSASSTRLADSNHKSGFHFVEITGRKLKFKRFEYSVIDKLFHESRLYSYE